MGARRVLVGVHASLDRWSAEVKYTLRTLLRLAGVSYGFVWVNGPTENADLDVYYGPAAEGSRASVSISAFGRRFADAQDVEPLKLRKQHNLAFLDFGEATGGLRRTEESKLHFLSDIVFASYWMLIGARESHYPRDRWDNLDLEGSFLQKSAVLPMPMVSIYAQMLRQHFQGIGVEPRPLPWASERAPATFVFTHDVDYPEMIRWIECFRLMAKPSGKSMRLISDILRGDQPFWKFSEWVSFEKRLNTRPAFYFMARRGSLVEYARGTPDAFYDVHSPRFRELFRFLREEGCEVGLHASYHAHRSAKQLQRERETLEEASGMTVQGNRHHYWHLDPAAPHETLRRAEEAGFVYDSSLEFESYPGFRRGICHPFRVFHPGERRELGIVELPPTWMDDHFDRRLVKNGIGDANAYALGLVQATRETGGVAVVDYHPRGMNGDYFPRYGPWLKQFVEQHLDSTVNYRMPGEIVRNYLEYEKALEANSLDRTIDACQARSSASENGQAQTSQASGGLSVDFLRPEEAAEWDAFVEEHPDGSIYHTMAWKAVTEEGLGHRAYYLRARTGDGKIAGVLPLFLVKGLIGRRLVSVPMRDRGGPLYYRPEAGRRLLEYAVALAGKTNAATIEIKYAGEKSGSGFDAAGFQEERHWITTVVPVMRDTEHMWNEVLRSPTRRAVKKSRNSGMTCRWSDKKEDLDSFYSLFLSARKHLGIPPYSPALFHAMYKHLGPQRHVRLLLVEKDGSAVAGLLVFPHKKEVISAYMGYDVKVSADRPNDMLFWEAIRWSGENGFNTFYFGADSPHQEGLLSFKRKWGGEQFVIPNHLWSAKGSREASGDSSDPRFATYRKIVSWTPMPVFRVVGGWLTRRLS